MKFLWKRTVFAHFRVISLKTQQKLWISTEFMHKKIRWNYGILCSVLLSANVFVAISSQIDSCILTLHSYPAPFFPSHCYLSGHDQIFIEFYCFSPAKCISTDFLFDPSLIGLPYLVFLFFVWFYVFNDLKHSKN